MNEQAAPSSDVAIIVADHGSRVPESNQMLLEVVKRFADESEFAIVEPAHMELAEPTIATAFDRCKARGAKTIVVHPYFLFPGRHWRDDIPRLCEQAAQRHPGLAYLVTEPLGLHPLMLQVIRSRIDETLGKAECRTGNEERRRK